jgi:uncharacterized protein involved in type VI secretion and phage assembly
MTVEPAELIVELVRRIVREELATSRTPLRLGFVQAVLAGGPDDDQDNYAVDVRLGDDWVLRAVPVCTPAPGLWALPRLDDHVVVGFVGGDAQRPLVLGAVHDSGHRPPAPPKGASDGRTFALCTGTEESSLRLDVSASGVAVVQGDQSTVITARKIVGK